LSGDLTFKTGQTNGFLLGLKGGYGDPVFLLRQNFYLTVSVHITIEGCQIRNYDTKVVVSVV
ncbi:TPA: hypothetical protein ACSJ8W_005044, partial [Escherichia coli]